MNEENPIKMLKLDSKSNIWESQLPVECPVGMNIKYKYLVIDSNNKKISEKLPNDTIRSITTKKPGQYIILNKKGELATKISFVERERRGTNRKLSRLFYNTLDPKDFMADSNENNLKNLKFNFGKSEFKSFKE
jgi:hypothetical protein